MQNGDGSRYDEYSDSDVSDAGTTDPAAPDAADAPDAPDAPDVVTPAAWASAILSAVTTAAEWLVIAGTVGTGSPQTTFLTALFGPLLYALPVLLLGSIVLAIAVGRRGGNNRLVAVIGGILILTPVIAALIVYAVDRTSSRSGL